MTRAILRLLFLASLCATVAAADDAACKYGYYGPNLSVYTADECCGPILPGGNASYCVINSTNCEILVNITMEGRTKLPRFNAIGDLSRSLVAYMKYGNKSLLVMKGMAFPKTLTTLTIENITTIDFNQIKTPFPDSMRRIDVLDSFLDVFPATFRWPVALKNLTLRGNRLQTIPKGLPDGLVSLAIQNNTLNDFNYLPPNLTFLNIRHNQYEKVVDMDWTNLNYLQLSYNPIKTIANIRLSDKIRFFGCMDCNVTNFTINQATFDALNVLPACDDDESTLKATCYRFNKNTAVDMAACTASSGKPLQLWPSDTTVKVNVCVTPNTLAPAPVPEATNHTGLIVGLAVGGVVLVALIAFFIVRKNKKAVYDGTGYYQNEFTNGTLNGTQGSAGDYSDMGLNVEDLRIHKLDIADLKVTAKKPLASGAFGEVWLATYCDEKVAVKRIKDRRIESVKKFIDEIKLMAMMESEFVVKFVGVSWRRPIEMEVVVEYMDLGDLRNYLMSRPPATYSWQEKFASIMSIVRGLVYLHTFEPPIIHRDLKSRNVLLDSAKGTKLTDFGASRQEADAGMTNGIGTYQWMAPEIIMGTEYTIAADIYSFGVILSEFSTHAVPYGDVKNAITGRAYTQQAIMSKVTAGELRPTFEQYETPVWVRDLGMQCMALNPDDRPTSLALTAILQRVKMQFYA